MLPYVVVKVYGVGNLAEAVMVLDVCNNFSFGLDPALKCHQESASVGQTNLHLM